MSKATTGKGRGDSSNPAVCNVCGIKTRWYDGKHVHCRGSRTTFSSRHDPHHGREAYPQCFKCGGAMGCTECCMPTELLCQACAAWGTPVALAEHGLVLNTEAAIAKRHRVVCRTVQCAGECGMGMAATLEEYPASFVTAYHVAAGVEATAGVPVLTVDESVAIINDVLKPQRVELFI